MAYKMIDLCAGIGGIRRGFELAKGFRNVLSAEIDKYACMTYEHLYGDNPQNDITTEERMDQVSSFHAPFHAARIQADRTGGPALFRVFGRGRLFNVPLTSRNADYFIF